jgi:hypothetical protein
MLPLEFGFPKLYFHGGHIRSLECCVVSSRESPICRKASKARICKVAGNQRAHVVQFLFGSLVSLGFLIGQ